MTFHRMTPGEGESLVQFHARLASQAELCGFGDFLQRLIRDRLLLVVDRDLQSKVLEGYVNPTVDDILAEYQKEQEVSGERRFTIN